MVNFQFYCRESKTNKNGYAYVELSIIINGKRTYISLDRKEIPSNFKKLVESKKNNDLKDYLALMREKINSAITDLLRHNEALTAESLKDYLKNGGVRYYSIENLFNDFLEVMRPSFEECNYKKYLLVRDEFYAHIDKEKEITAVTNAVIRSFMIKEYKTFSESTAAGKMAKLKAVMMFGLNNAKMTINPFGNIVISKPKDKIEYLEDEELEVIIKKEFACDRLNQVKDLFIFQAGSGLAYADMASLRPEDVQEKEGIYFIKKNRQKTDIEYTAILLPCAIEVLRKYDFCLPVISNQKLNSYLKEIGDCCGLKKSLHSHLARKTYCTHLINSGTRLEVVSKCAGHSNTRITQAIYAHLQTKTILKEVSEKI